MTQCHVSSGIFPLTVKALPKLAGRSNAERKRETAEVHCNQKAIIPNLLKIFAAIFAGS